MKIPLFTKFPFSESRTMAIMKMNFKKNEIDSPPELHIWRLPLYDAYLIWVVVDAAVTDTKWSAAQLLPLLYQVSGHLPVIHVVNILLKDLTVFGYMLVFFLFRKKKPVLTSVVNPDWNWICIQKLCGSESVNTRII